MGRGEAARRTFTKVAYRYDRSYKLHRHYFLKIVIGARGLAARETAEGTAVRERVRTAFCFYTDGLHHAAAFFGAVAGVNV